MPRRARIIIPGVAHHVTQRGNNHQKIFDGKEDFSSYCFWINKYAKQYGVKILAYCLMNNHVHLVVVPKGRESLSLLFRSSNTCYAQYINHKRQSSGHVWQGRFFSCVLDDAHLYRAIRYVEQNPVRANMVARPWDYEWSSARWHVKKPVKKYIKVEETASIDKRYWRKYLKESDAAVDDQIRKKTHQGKAVAGDEFIDHWEKRLQCVLRELKSGPPKKIA